MQRLTLYFDYLSPYAYLAWAQLRGRDDLDLQPVLFAGLLAHHGQLGPAEIPAKRKWLGRDVFRQAMRYDVPFRFPASHPFNPLTALRVSLPEVAGDDQAKVVAALYEHAWRQGGELGDDGEVAGALDRAGLDGTALVAQTKDPAIKQQLKDATAAAIDRDVFGVPTLFVGDESFWGADRVADALAVQRGELVLDAAALAAASTIRASAERKR